MTNEIENQEVKVYECPECERPVSEEYMICFTCQVEDFR